MAQWTVPQKSACLDSSNPYAHTLVILSGFRPKMLSVYADDFFSLFTNNETVHYDYLKCSDTALYVRFADTDWISMPEFPLWICQ